MGDHPNKVNVAELEWEKREHGELFGAEQKRLALRSGGEKLGCSLFRVPPGKTAFPAHLHHTNEEALFILSGQGTLRLGDTEIPVGEGDYVTLPAGGPAHQLLNRSGAMLEYLCLSTMISPEVAEYPDSGKIGVMVAGATPDPAKRKIWKIFKKGSDVEYYEGEG